LRYRGPFVNVQPEVGYVGSAKCAGCHADIARSYAEHPMARTLIPISKLAPVQVYDRPHRNPFMAFDSLFTVERKGERVWHRQTAPAKSKPVYELEFEVHYAIGSGSHGHSYLSNRDGYVFQTPVSWFTQKEIWDKSPGFAAEACVGRPIQGPCLFCHSNRALSMDNQLNRYAAPIFPGEHGIGCERCHGPGEKHITHAGSMVPLPGAAAGEELDPTIVNPAKLKKLSPDLAEGVCRQCHLTGEARILRRGRGLYDFRPGLPLQDFVTLFVLTGQTNQAWRAVNHVEQMHLSRCFQGSGKENKLGCVSCHDPHKHIGPDQRVDFYRQRCLSCHADGGTPVTRKQVAPKPAAQSPSCSLPLDRRKSANHNSCIDCHMTRYTAADIVHNASTDHQILRFPPKVEADAAPNYAAASLTPFPGPPVDLKDKEMARDFGLALADKSKYSLAFARDAVLLLEAALQDDPDDVEVWERKGFVFLQQANLRPALAAFQTAIARDPNRELSMHKAATLAYQLGEREEATSYFRRVCELNPWLPEYRRGLATVLAERGAWEEASRECQAWLRLAPGSIDGRKLWIECLLAKGQGTEARAELARIQALHSGNFDQINEWFARKSREKHAD
jgi:Flp pilus assembly protein TadD